ncbi:MAG TPA: hypothetical protein VNZ52_10250, partial [Candidatus Thermoplasmatota archaeon]|nr:hypothetical protein [Candidatus Thermoplasmatota archaeon]
MTQADVLEYEVRRTVYEAVRANPGVHARRLQRLVDIPMSTLVYHLRYLEKHQVVLAKEDKYYKRYYVREEVGRDDKPVLAALQQEKLRRIVLAVLEGGDVGYGALKEAVPLPASTLSLHLKELVDLGVLARRRVGRETRYVVANEGQVVALLMRYRESLVDRLMDRVVALWRARS